MISFKFIVSKYNNPRWLEILCVHKRKVIGDLHIKQTLKIPLDINAFKQFVHKELSSGAIRFKRNMSGGI